ncbi:MAG: hypothetical protein WC394_04985, partial [Candidatus Omnitrophota bacterium]
MNGLNISLLKRSWLKSGTIKPWQGLVMRRIVIGKITTVYASLIWLPTGEKLAEISYDPVSGYNITVFGKDGFYEKKFPASVYSISFITDPVLSGAYNAHLDSIVGKFKFRGLGKELQWLELLKTQNRINKMLNLYFGVMRQVREIMDFIGRLIDIEKVRSGNAAYIAQNQDRMVFNANRLFLMERFGSLSIYLEELKKEITAIRQRIELIGNSDNQVGFDAAVNWLGGCIDTLANIQRGNAAEIDGLSELLRTISDSSEIGIIYPLLSFMIPWEYRLKNFRKYMVWLLTESGVQLMPNGDLELPATAAQPVFAPAVVPAAPVDSTKLFGAALFPLLFNSSIPDLNHSSIIIKYVIIAAAILAFLVASRPLIEKGIAKLLERRAKRTPQRELFMIEKVFSILLLFVLSKTTIFACLFLSGIEFVKNFILSLFLDNPIKKNGTEFPVSDILTVQNVHRKSSLDMALSFWASYVQVRNIQQVTAKELAYFLSPHSKWEHEAASQGKEPFRQMDNAARGGFDDREIFLIYHRGKYHPILINGNHRIMLMFAIADWEGIDISKVTFVSDEIIHLPANFIGDIIFSLLFMPILILMQRFDLFANAARIYERLMKSETSAYPLLVPLADQNQAEQRYGQNKNLTDINVNNLDLQYPEAFVDNHYNVLQQVLKLLEQLLGRAPPKLFKWRLIITTDSNFTEGNVAACNIDDKIVYIHPYFFKLDQTRQLEILYHELISHICKGLSDINDAAMRDTRLGIVFRTFMPLLFGDDFKVGNESRGFITREYLRYIVGSDQFDPEYLVAMFEDISQKWPELGVKFSPAVDPNILQTERIAHDPDFSLSIGGGWYIHHGSKLRLRIITADSLKERNKLEGPSEEIIAGLEEISDAAFKNGEKEVYEIATWLVSRIEQRLRCGWLPSWFILEARDTQGVLCGLVRA